MSKVVFFNIPAHGHTNPTLEIVKELVRQEHEVIYYSFSAFKEKIEAVGGKFISCDESLPPLALEDEKKIGKDFSALIEMVVETTIALEEKVCEELNIFQPDCVIYDSMCIWGKLFATKLNIPSICSTTTFAFNQQTAKYMKQSLNEILGMLSGMPRVNKKLERLRQRGYEIPNLISLIENNNQTNTIVYTSREFQPLVETFSLHYRFIGPSIANDIMTHEKKNRPKVYISLGTVNNQEKRFYKNCIQAFQDVEVEVIMSVGEKTNLSDLGRIPKHFKIEHYVNQIQVLQTSDIFLTHGGMNSVNESLYYRVPMILFPRQSEQRMVANRVVELGAGKLLKRNHPNVIRETTLSILNQPKYKENAIQISQSFKTSGGSKEAVCFIQQIIQSSQVTTLE